MESPTTRTTSCVVAAQTPPERSVCSASVWLRLYTLRELPEKWCRLCSVATQTEDRRGPPRARARRRWSGRRARCRSAARYSTRAAARRRASRPRYSRRCLQKRRPWRAADIFRLEALHRGAGAARRLADAERPTRPESRQTKCIAVVQQAQPAAGRRTSGGSVGALAARTFLTIRCRSVRPKERPRCRLASSWDTWRCYPPVRTWSSGGTTPAAPSDSGSAALIFGVSAGNLACRQARRRRPSVPIESSTNLARPRAPPAHTVPWRSSIIACDRASRQAIALQSCTICPLRNRLTPPGLRSQSRGCRRVRQLRRARCSPAARARRAFPTTKTGGRRTAPGRWSCPATGSRRGPA